MDSEAEYSALSSTRSQKKYKKEETKTSKRQCPSNLVQIKIREGNTERIMSDYEGKDL